MSAGHHGEWDPQRRAELDNEIMRRFVEQAEGKAKRQYSQGRMSADDEGDLAMAVAVDPVKKIVILRFGKPVEWIGMGEAEVKALVQNLIAKLKVIATEPFSVEV